MVSPTKTGFAKAGSNIAERIQDSHAENRASRTPPCQNVFWPAGLEGLREGYGKPVRVAAPVAQVESRRALLSVDRMAVILALARDVADRLPVTT
jgi:hypothetical protein